MKTLRSMPVIDVTDVTKSVAFYARLGFRGHGIWDDPTTGFSIVQRGDVTIGLNGHHDGVSRNGGWAAYIYVNDIEKLHAEFLGLGLEPTPLGAVKPYGCRDFDMVDLDGHRIAFGQDMSPENGPGLSDERGRG